MIPSARTDSLMKSDRRTIVVGTSRIRPGRLAAAPRVGEATEVVAEVAGGRAPEARESPRGAVVRGRPPCP